jgi:hypothetical protein
MMTMPLCMTVTTNQFIEYADKRGADFVTVSQNPTETRESDLKFPEEWTFPDPLGQCTPVNFFCPSISSDSYKIMQKGGRFMHVCMALKEMEEIGTLLECRKYMKVVTTMWCLRIDDVRVHLHSIWLCNVDEYDGHVCNLTTIYNFLQKNGKAAVAAAPAWQ